MLLTSIAGIAFLSLHQLCLDILTHTVLIKSEILLRNFWQSFLRLPVCDVISMLEKMKEVLS